MGFPVSPVDRRPTERRCEEVVCVRDAGQQEPRPAGPPTAGLHMRRPQQCRRRLKVISESTPSLESGPKRTFKH